MEPVDTFPAFEVCRRRRNDYCELALGAVKRGWYHQKNAQTGDSDV